ARVFRVDWDGSTATLEPLVTAADINDAMVAECLAVADAYDGSATTFQRVRRADDAPASGNIPANWAAVGDPLAVADFVGELIIVPGPDLTEESGPEDWSKVYRITASGPWEEIEVPNGQPIL